jgi:O-glycosyl hydrolase
MLYAHLLIRLAFRCSLLLCRDGLELATVIAENMSANKESWLQVIRGFEAQMQARAWAEEDADTGFDTFISDGDSASRVLSRMQQRMNAQS